MLSWKESIAEESLKLEKATDAICAKYGVVRDTTIPYDGWKNRLNDILEPDGEHDAPEITALSGWRTALYKIEQAHQTQEWALNEKIALANAEVGNLGDY